LKIYIHASNPTPNPIEMSLEIYLSGNNDIEKKVKIEIDKETWIQDFPCGSITFDKPGNEELYIIAKLNNETVDEIGPIFINIVKAKGLNKDDDKGIPGFEITLLFLIIFIFMLKKRRNKS